MSTTSLFQRCLKRRISCILKSANILDWCFYWEWWAMLQNKILWKRRPCSIKILYKECKIHIHIYAIFIAVTRTPDSVIGW